MPTLLNVRLGFANNSSSSHSIVFLKNPSAASDNDSSGYEFGWDFFTAISRRSKENYLIATVGSHLKDMVGEGTARIILGHLLNRNVNDMELDGYVDHQSCLVIPQDFYGNSIDIEYFKELSEVLLRDDVAVLGGNDNEEKSHPLIADSSGPALKGVPDDNYSSGWVARKDDNVWVFFHRPTGNKIRFSFDNNAKYKRSSLPELVDIKITDFCPYGCVFCYQGSTTEGKHADRYAVSSYASVLSKNKVFEVALGGGEPTLHPDFVEILRDFQSKGIVPNFTTRNLAWLRGDHREEILRLCGSFAVSTENAKDISKLADSLRYHRVDFKKATLQFIAGATDKWKFRQLVETAIKEGLTYTILGYKTTGRGDSFKPASTADDCWNVLMELLEKYPYMRVGIDTVFAEQIEHRLKEQKVHPAFYHTKDGVFSCYIDAVKKMIAPSSYCEESKYKAYEHRYSSSHSEFGRIYRSLV